MVTPLGGDASPCCDRVYLTVSNSANAALLANLETTWVAVADAAATSAGAGGCTPHPPIPLLVAPLDDDIARSLAARGSRMGVVALPGVSNSFGKEHSGWSKSGFNQMSLQKFVAVSASLAAASSVLVLDPDVVLLRDVWTYVDGLPLCDVYMQVQPKGLPNATQVRARGGQFYDNDYPHHYNTGVFAMRAGRGLEAPNGVLPRFLEWAASPNKGAVAGGGDDQALFNTFLYRKYSVTGLSGGLKEGVTGVKSRGDAVADAALTRRCLMYTPSEGEGGVFTMWPFSPYTVPDRRAFSEHKAVEVTLEPPVAVHYNSASGPDEKKKFMEETGLWVVT